MFKLVFSALGIIFFLFPTIYAQQKTSLAVLSSDNSERTQILRNTFEKFLGKKSKIIDGSQSDSVLQSLAYPNLYNLSSEDSKILGNAIGCNFLVILKSDNLRRNSLIKNTYYESYVAVYVVSTRTGRLVFWTLKSFEDQYPINADKQLSTSLENLTDEISAKIDSAYQTEFNEKPLANLEELPEENSPEAKNFRSPLPFKRIRPVYTATANLYSIAATVDAVVDLDETGEITNIEIIRWAGYELDESVIKTIREMQWRPASRDGKTLPIRVLLRYNFKKVTDQNQ